MEEGLKGWVYLVGMAPGCRTRRQGSHGLSCFRQDYGIGMSVIEFNYKLINAKGGIKGRK